MTEKFVDCILGSRDPGPFFNPEVPGLGDNFSGIFGIISLLPNIFLKCTQQPFNAIFCEKKVNKVLIISFCIWAINMMTVLSIAL